MGPPKTIGWGVIGREVGLEEALKLYKHFILLPGDSPRTTATAKFTATGTSLRAMHRSDKTFETQDQVWVKIRFECFWGIFFCLRN